VRKWIGDLLGSIESIASGIFKKEFLEDYEAWLARRADLAMVILIKESQSSCGK